MISIPFSHTVTISIDKLINSCDTTQLNELILLAGKELRRREQMEAWAETFDVSDPMPSVFRLQEIKEGGANE